MAKKSRTPRPPQRVQAPKRRVDTRSGSPFTGFPRWGWAVAGAAVVALALVATFAFGGGSSGVSEASVAKAMTSAGCTYKSVPPKPPKKDPTNYHADVPKLTTSTKGLWSTFPPSGGAHYQVQDDAHHPMWSPRDGRAVSYTHLTLPTICSV